MDGWSTDWMDGVGDGWMVVLMVVASTGVSFVLLGSLGSWFGCLVVSAGICAGSVGAITSLGSLSPLPITVTDGTCIFARLSLSIIFNLLITLLPF
jgi:hypothetical protein